MAGPNYATLPDPNTLQFVDWAAITAEQLASFGVSSPTTEADWRTWAFGLLNSGLPGAPVPNPDGFANWQSWASSLIGTLT